MAAARQVLIDEGVAGVKVRRIAQRLGVTRGGFYWRFSGPAGLLDELLENWRATNAASSLAAIRSEGTPAERFGRLLFAWIDEERFDPKYDMAVREWARTSRKADLAVRRYDDELVDALAQLFVDASYDRDESLIRARIVYYHQIGYYALRVKQTRVNRYQVAHLYLRILTGFPGEQFAALKEAIRQVSSRRSATRPAADD
ncbi:MAG TPA: helix-turn-helix domain-containing protein [Caulobacteraceae bacterium]